MDLYMDLYAARHLLERAGYVVLDPGDVTTLRRFVDGDDAHAVLGYIEAALPAPQRPDPTDRQED